MNKVLSQAIKKAVSDFKTSVEVKNINNKFHIVNTEKLIKKLKSLLSDEEQMQNIYSNYCKAINAGHLKIHRSKYIINLGKKLIEGKLKI